MATIEQKYHIDTSSHSYMLGVAEYERDRFRTALRRIISLGEKNVTKFAQQIAREALAGDVGSAVP